MLTTNLKTFPKLLQSPQVKTSSDELPAVFRETLGNHSADSRQAPRLHDLILASSDELLRQAMIFLGELRELPTYILELPTYILASFRKPFGKLPTHSRLVPTAFPTNLQTSVELSNSQQILRA